MKKKFICCLLVLLFVGACKTTPPLPEKVFYRCDFDIATYYPDAESREIETLSELLVWINKRVRGKFPVGHSISLSHHVQQKIAAFPATNDDKERRMIWLLPSEMMKGKTPISVMIDRRDGKFILTKVNEEDRSALGYRPAQFLDVKNLRKKMYEFRDVGYCG